MCKCAASWLQCWLQEYLEERAAERCFSFPHHGELLFILHRVSLCCLLASRLFISDPGSKPCLRRPSSGLDIPGSQRGKMRMCRALERGDVSRGRAKTPRGMSAPATLRRAQGCSFGPGEWGTAGVWGRCGRRVVGSRGRGSEVDYPSFERSVLANSARSGRKS